MKNGFNTLYVNKGGRGINFTIGYATKAGSADTVPDSSITPAKLDCGIVRKNGNFLFHVCRPFGRTLI
jgi:hypothetical protein